MAPLNVIMLGASEDDQVESSFVEKEAVRDKNYVHGEAEGICSYGGCAVQGYPGYMEDEFAVARLKEVLFVGVFDGHRGSSVSRFCALHLPEQLLKTVKRMDTGRSIQDCLCDTFLGMDRILAGNRARVQLGRLEALKSLAEYKDGVRAAWDEGETGNASDIQVGSTALALLVSDGSIVVANAGDCRCVLCKNTDSGRLALDLTNDHSPSERGRVEKAGGTVDDGRVCLGGSDKSLGVARAIGDLDFKANPGFSLEEQVVTSLPEVVEVEREEDDEFLVVASDGIWGTRTSEEVVQFIGVRLGVMPLEDICGELIDSCLDDPRSPSKDNMTLVIVHL